MTKSKLAKQSLAWGIVANVAPAIHPMPRTATIVAPQWAPTVVNVDKSIGILLNSVRAAVRLWGEPTNALFSRSVHRFIVGVTSFNN